MRVKSCPIHKCMYRCTDGRCGYQDLVGKHADALTVERIASIRGLESNTVKEQAQIGKHNLSIAMIIDRYAEFISDSFTGIPVNIETEQPTEKLLRRVFDLNPDQQMHFWSRSRFENWCKHQKIQEEITLTEVYRVLKEITAFEA